MQEALTTALEISALGITIVFVALTLMALTLTLVNRVTRPRPHAAAADATDATDAAADAAAVPPDVMVVLAAAAAAALDRPVRVAHVRYRASAPDTGWAHRGRAAVMGSHRVRR